MGQKMKHLADSSLERVAYTLKEVAKMVGVSESHLRNEHRRGKLVLVHSARCTRILAEDLHEYLKGLRRIQKSAK
jgi:hypothetical protein